MLGLVAALALLVGVSFLIGWGVARGLFGELQDAGSVTREARPERTVRDLASRQAAARDLAASRTDTAAAPDKQILFGDLHVHTTFSGDAFFFSLPIIQGEGAHPPADACDFARFCSALDFWSINDHAEILTPRQWTDTRESIRQCNAVAGSEADPDLVAFLGWEWTQMGDTPEDHFGHKNVVLLDTDEGRVPVRPISAGPSPVDGLIRDLPGWMRVAMAYVDLPDLAPYLEFGAFSREVSATEPCAEGVPVRELPEDCFEAAPTPEQLFAKLDDWGFESFVIPHGTSWGIHAPPESTLATQLVAGRHDPDRQRLFEVYSGHGSSEPYRSWRHVGRDAQNTAFCPEPSPGFTACCWRAGELIRARCEGASQTECDERVADARRLFVEAGRDPRRFQIVPGATPEEWLECGQLTDDDLPAYVYRPAMSAQYALATGSFEDPEAPLRFRFGLMASSDNHKARAGTGYKEFARKAMTDAWGFRTGAFGEPTPVERAALPVSIQEIPILSAFGPERGASFYYTGGLVAVHSARRDRSSIWEALGRREVYGTSGDRMLLWFDLVREDGSRIPMGSEVALSGAPRFEARAVGALEQLPGCPDYAEDSLGPERLERLCLGQCYHPSDRRKPIRRIEVVRIRPQAHGNEPIESLIEDPWRSFECEPDPAGCAVQFEDPEFEAGGRETLYYVRALQEPSLAVNADRLRCERDESGRCIRSRPCYASGPQFDPADDCLAPVEERAWSSPIFIEPAAGAEGG